MCRYEVRDRHIDYWDDTGSAADGEWIDGILHHAGMILSRKEQERHERLIAHEAPPSSEARRAGRRGTGRAGFDAARPSPPPKVTFQRRCASCRRSPRSASD
ncbi:Atu4866 domain-containing protein [Plastorhodobacter daqingensis]|uniref:Atu4866 domain-containing protein n=1 Tax=Plastorhodobacter daqingensis TaxID=1387281 RepID=A0ABW2UNQ4_9RHOB